MGVIATLRQHLRNPDSSIWESVHANQDASIVCISYRAQNGFGGMNREPVMGIGNEVRQDPALWKKNCPKALFDILADIKNVQQPKWYQNASP
jgi:hypothetical protein